MECKLSEKKCVPCEGGVPPLDRSTVDKLLRDLDGWSLAGNQIEKQFAFKDFVRNMKFVNAIAEVAEKEGHHPDLHIHGWNKLRVTLSTHAINGLTENDFIVAAKIDEIPKPN